MTYAALLKKLSKMTPEQLAMDVTICTQDEFYAAEMLVTDDTEDRLDENHPYFKIKSEE